MIHMSLAHFLKTHLPQYATYFYERASLKRLNTWRVGGEAECLFEPPSIEAIQAVFKILPLEIPITWLGLGSNVLISDSGIEGLVIMTQAGLSKLTHEGGLFFAEAGVPCAKLARFSAREGYEGGEFFAGIPGTVGGALAMNAGAFGKETWDCVKEVCCIDRAGNCHIRDKFDFTIGYRTVESRVELEWFVSARFQLKIGDANVAKDKIKLFLTQRKETQPTGEHTCGSVFQNPEGDYAGRLIEAAGLKGYSIGDAVISSKHANFIVNRGNATAADIHSLIGHAQDTVHQQFKLKLKPEVRLMIPWTHAHKEKS